MFGIADLVYSPHIKRSLQKGIFEPNEYFHFWVASRKYSDAKILWICFSGVGSKIELDDSSWGAHHLLPKEGLVYSIWCPLSICGRLPEDVIRSMDMLEEQVERLVTKNPEKEVRVFGYSAGTLPAFYFANKYGAKELVVLAPGCSMGRAIFAMDVLHPCKIYAMWHGYTRETYDREIAKYNQENNLDRLMNTNITILAGLFDRILPYRGTKELIELMRIKWIPFRLTVYKMFDHVSLGMMCGFWNKLRFRFSRNPKHIWE